MEAFKTLEMFSLCRPSFTCIEKGRKYTCIVDFDLSTQRNPSFPKATLALLICKNTSSSRVPVIFNVLPKYTNYTSISATVVMNDIHTRWKVCFGVRAMTVQLREDIT